MAREKEEKQEVALTSQELLQLLGGALESPNTPSTLEGACSSVCAEFIIGDLKKQTIRELWTSQKALSLFQQVQSTFPDDSACKNCEDFVECRQGKGVCYKNILKAYGIANWQYPDPGCPRAGKPTQQFWLE